MALVATYHHLIPRGDAQLFAIPALSEVALLLDGMHGHDHYHHKPVLIMRVDADPNEISHMVEKFLSVLFISPSLPLI